ncbi:universal stress protein [Psychroserpens sp. MEBiC05023]
MKSNKYKILVLSNLKGSTTSTLKNTISLSKMIDANIEFFHVKKPTDIVETDSQLSAMRTINKERIVTEKKIKQLITSISNDYDVDIKTSFAFGNIKNEIKDHIEKTKPDIIVLGKRKQKALSFIGDNVTGFVLDTFDGPVMLASEKYGLEPEKELSLGFFNNNKHTSNLGFTEHLINQTDQPLMSFNIVDKPGQQNENLISSSNNTVDFVFEKNDNAFKTLSNYLEKNNVNLLCVNRSHISGRQSKVKSEIKEVVDKVNVSLFLTR